jgi:hypothetical protein
LIVKLKALSAIWAIKPLSVALTVMLKVPVTVGVPLSTPPAERLSPPGSEPEESDHLYGVVPPFAENVREYVVPMIPEGRGDPVVIDSGLGAGFTSRLNVF